MKKIAILMLALAVVAGCKSKTKISVDTVENGIENAADAVGNGAKNAVDAVKSAVERAGTYSGTIPCADCEGIETTITLDDRGNFTRTIKYLTNRAGNHEYTDNGTVQTDAMGTVLTLGEEKYLFVPGTLTMLDTEGKRIEGELAELYILKKQK